MVTTFFMLLFDAAVLAAPSVRSSPTVSTGHFLVEQDGDAAPLVALLEEDRRRFFALFGDAGFTLYEPAAPLRWVLCDDQRRLDAVSRELEPDAPAGLEAWYSPRTNRVALVRSASAVGVDGAEAAHELAHQLAFNSGLMRRGVVYPLWVVEGVADHFAAAVSAEAAPRVPSAADPLAGAAPDGGVRRVSLRELVTLTRLPEDEPAAVAAIYAQAHSLFDFLLTRHREALVAYLRALGDAGPGDPGRRALEGRFVAAFGDVPALEQAWAESAGSPSF